MRHLALALILAAAAVPVRSHTFEIDPVHSSVSFRIKHLVGKVTGRFGKFSGTYALEPGKVSAWSASATIDPASIDTGIGKRDDHLRSADFFDVERCPAMGFKSSKVTAVKGNTAKLHGDLTMHCVTKPVVLDLEIGGTEKDPWGNTRSGASARTKLNRKDFGIVWNKTLDSGGLMLGEDVEVTLEIEGVVKQAEPKKAD